MARVEKARIERVGDEKRALRSMQSIGAGGTEM